MKNINKIWVYACLAILCLLGGSNVANAKTLTPAELLQKCGTKLKSASSIRCDFTMAASGKSLTGNIQSKGSKFAVNVSGAATWYDGKTMWSYSKASGETTVWYPGKAELAEANPLLYLSSTSEKEFNVSEQSANKAGLRTLILTPKKRNMGIKRVVVQINTSTLLPTSIKIESPSGNIGIAIRSLKLNISIPDNVFKYDSKKYKNVQVTDLR